MLKGRCQAPALQKSLQASVAVCCSYETLLSEPGVAWLGVNKTLFIRTGNGPDSSIVIIFFLLAYIWKDLMTIY